MTHNEVPKDTVEELVGQFRDQTQTPRLQGHALDFYNLDHWLIDVLTTAYNKGVEVERERIEDEFARVADYTEDVTADVLGEPINTSFYRLYEGQWEHIIKPKVTPLPDDKL